jgi:hypothetical protein
MWGQWHCAAPESMLSGAAQARQQMCGRCTSSPNGCFYKQPNTPSAHRACDDKPANLLTC